MKTVLVLLILFSFSLGQNTETINRVVNFNSVLDIPLGEKLSYLSTSGGCAYCDFNIMKGVEYDKFMNNRPFSTLYYNQSSFSYLSSDKDILSSNLYLTCRTRQPTTVTYTITRTVVPPETNVGLIVGLTVGLILGIPLLLILLAGLCCGFAVYRLSQGDCKVTGVGTACNIL